MAVSSTPKALTALEHFTQLNECTWINVPASTSATSSSAPDLILLAGWMGASPKHISKYTAGYEKLWPSVRILALTTTAYEIFGSQSANLDHVAPAVAILLALPPDARLLVHCFSNGGAWRACLIAQAYREKMGRPLPATAMVLDSAPGRDRYGTTVRAFSVSLPKNIMLYMLGAVALRIAYVVLKLATWLGLHRDPIQQVRHDLNNKDFFDADARRLYIYSDTDGMVDSRFVEEHIEEARSLGYPVRGDKFTGSMHCGHLLKDFERYWATVLATWEIVF